MSGFSEDEIAAEMNRRHDAIKKRESDHLESATSAEHNGCDTVCLHCGTPVKSYMVTDLANPLCDKCLGD